MTEMFFARPQCTYTPETYINSISLVELVDFPFLNVGYQDIIDYIIDGHKPKTRISKFTIVQETKKKQEHFEMPQYNVLILVKYANNIF